MKKFSIASKNSKLNSSRLSNSSKPQGTGFASPSHNNNDTSIENLSTLRSGEAIEREKALVDKVRSLKKENGKLVQLLKESEAVFTEKLT